MQWVAISDAAENKNCHHMTHQICQPEWSAQQTVKNSKTSTCKQECTPSNELIFGYSLCFPLGFLCIRGESAVTGSELKGGAGGGEAFLRLISVKINTVGYFDEFLKDSKSHKMKSYKGFAFILMSI